MDNQNDKLIAASIAIACVVMALAVVLFINFGGPGSSTTSTRTETQVNTKHDITRNADGVPELPKNYLKIYGPIYIKPNEKFHFVVHERITLVTPNRHCLVNIRGTNFTVSWEEDATFIKFKLKDTTKPAEIIGRAVPIGHPQCKL